MKRLPILLITLLLTLASCYIPNPRTKNAANTMHADSSVKSDSDKNKNASISKTNKPIIKSAYTHKYSLRKYQNVTKFYSRIAKEATTICMENNVPPAAILAMAGLESGWNEGYVSKITGNILSLGTRRGDHQLPALQLARLKFKKTILFDSLEILKYNKKDIIWENRPPSLKKDYRPLPYAGTKNNLAYFKYYPEKETQAHIQNLNDFMLHFISRKSKIPAYKNARILMDKLVAEKGKDILLNDSTAFLFINEIGGKPYSFNYRKNWPKKVKNIIKKAGLGDLSKQLYSDKREFKNIW